jgi:hypothetical protein
MIRRLLLTVPVLALFFAAAIIVLAARAPRTWATHWTNPRAVSAAGGEYDYGAVRTGSSGWDLLWADGASQKLIFTVDRGGGHSQSIAVDSGDVSQPDLVQMGGRELGVWVRNENGRTVLMGAYLGPGPRAHVYQLLSSTAPLEHPYLVRGLKGTAAVVFSWQLYGNYDVFLSPIGPGPLRIFPRRITKAEYYSFFPRAIADAHGVIHMLHLESCCSQKTWLVLYDRYDLRGHHLGTTQRLSTLESLPNAVPAQWPEELAIDPAGNVWGAYAGDAGMYMFEASPDGTIRRPPFQVYAGDGRPNSLSLALGRTVGYLASEQGYDLGTYIDTRRFELNGGAASATERAVYASGSQLQPHVFVAGDTATIIWESTDQSRNSTFQTSKYRPAGTPTLAQRIGLGLGNPWEEVAVLLLGSVSFAILTTTVNILWVLMLTMVGILTIRILRWLPSKWIVYACILASILFLVFVSPGAPILFLDTMPASGLAVFPFGLMAFVAVLAFVTFMATVPLRRVDDAYRAGLMAFVGVYFFAFVEAVVFIQQRLGYI